MFTLLTNLGMLINEGAEDIRELHWRYCSRLNFTNRNLSKMHLLPVECLIKDFSQRALRWS